LGVESSAEEHFVRISRKIQTF